MDIEERRLDGNAAAGLLGEIFPFDMTMVRTLCAGCGHNAITERIIEAFYEMGVEPWRVAKLSGIGCSSKSPAYFLRSAHGFNAVHGRMPSVATGTMLANHSLIAVGVSGDGDTASIGMGNFLHMVRRNVPMIYVVENNGCYGLTKGQFSATADRGSVQKGGGVNQMPPIDTVIIPSKEKPSGVGEPSTPVIAPALANAILALDGKPLRALPLSGQGVTFA